MDILLIIIGVICLIVAMLGCVLPLLPGPPLAYVGMGDEICRRNQVGQLGMRYRHGGRAVFPPWGIVLGPFLGAVIGELVGDKKLKDALRSGFGSLVGFLFGTVIKLMLCGYFVWQFIAAFFRLQS